MIFLYLFLFVLLVVSGLDKRFCIYKTLNIKPGNNHYNKTPNIIINLNGKNIYAFKLIIKNNKLCFYYKTNLQTLIIYNNRIIFKSVNKNNVCLILFVCKQHKYKVTSFGVWQNNYFFGYNKQAQIVADDNKFRVIKKFKNCNNFDVYYCAQQGDMQSVKNIQNKGLINRHNFVIDFVNNIVKIPNCNNFNNLLNLKIFSIKKHKNYYLINNLYYIKFDNNCAFVMLKKQDCFTSSTRHLFAIKIKTNNFKFNNYFNYELPQKIINYYYKNFNFVNFDYWLKFALLNNNSYVSEYYFYLNKFGINDLKNNVVYFCNPTFLYSKVVLQICGKNLNYYQKNNKYYINYNGIDFCNIKSLNLNTFIKPFEKIN